MESAPRNPRTLGKTLVRGLGVLVAVGLITFAVNSVPWSDTLSVTAIQGQEPEVYPGEIVGSWRSEVVAFRFQAGTFPGPELQVSGMDILAQVGGVVQVDRGSDQLRSEGLTLAASVEATPGMPTVFKDLDPVDIWPALTLLFVASLFIVTRWWLLLLLAGCPTRWVEALRLTYVGLFFNTVLPGSTGGDLVRAYVVVRGHSERRADALTSVAADRVIGLLGMTFLSAAAIWSADARFAELRPWVLLALAALVGGGLTVVNPWIRRLIRFDRLLARLPQGKRFLKVDEAVRAYTRHPKALLGALLLSMGNHLCSTGCCYFIGHALGDTHGFHDYVCIVTVANTISSLPLSPGGLGVGEVAFGSLLAIANGSYMIGVATSIVYRLSLALLGLGGGLALLLPGGAQVRSGYAAVREGKAIASGPEDPIPPPQSP